MNFIRLFYDDAPPDKGTGGAPDKTDVTNTGVDKGSTSNSDKPVDNNPDKNKDAGGTQPEPPKPFFSEDELKEFGVTTQEEAKEMLRTLKAKEKELSKPNADKEKEAELEKVNVRKFAVEKGLMKDADFTKLDTYTAKQDRDLVYENYLGSWKEENPHLSGDEADRQAKEDFENEYSLNSTNQKTKLRGQTRLTKEAESFRSPLQQSYNSTLEQYREEQTIAQKLPEFNKWVDGIINSNLKDKITITTKEGEEDIAIETELTDDQKKEIRKTFKTAKVFTQYHSANKDQIASLEKAIAKKIDGFIKINNFEAIAKKGYDVGKGIGTNKGSNKGADNPFALKKDDKGKDTPVVSMDQSNDKIAAARAKYRNQ